MSEEQNKEVDPRLEENWKIMTILQIPWHHILEIPDEHRPFLVEKAKEVEGFLQQQQEQQQKMQEEVNSRKNDKFIKNLKTKREFVMKRYSYYTQKLIKLKNHDKIKSRPT